MYRGRNRDLLGQQPWQFPGSFEKSQGGGKERGGPPCHMRRSDVGRGDKPVAHGRHQLAHLPAQTARAGDEHHLRPKKDWDAEKTGVGSQKS